MPAYAEHLHWVFGTKSQDELLKVVRSMTLEGVADEIKCSLLVVHGENDRQVPLWHADGHRSGDREPRQGIEGVAGWPTAAPSIAGPTTTAMVVDYMADWVAEKLGGNPNGA